MMFATQCGSHLRQQLNLFPQHVTDLRLLSLCCVVADLCVGKDCSGQGSCMEGVCRCNPGFAGDNCERVGECTGEASRLSIVCSDKCLL
jgi:hypothetical protein